MLQNDFYSQAMQGPYQTYDLGNFTLEEGGTIRGCQLAYATHGKLNKKKDNAILIPSWFSGTSKIFEQAYIMTQGGPARATVTTVYYIYENGFQWYKMGYASAVAWALFALIMLVTLIQWRYQDRWVFYE